MTRYAEAYRIELARFVAFATGEAVSVPSGIDGLRALELADAADHSRRTGERVRIV